MTYSSRGRNLPFFEHLLTQQASLMAQMVKNLPDNAGNVRDESLIPGLGRFPGEGTGYPFQYTEAQGG